MLSWTNQLRRQHKIQTRAQFCQNKIQRQACRVLALLKVTQKVDPYCTVRQALFVKMNAHPGWGVSSVLHKIQNSSSRTPCNAPFPTHIGCDLLLTARFFFKIHFVHVHVFLFLMLINWNHVLWFDLLYTTFLCTFIILMTVLFIIVFRLVQGQWLLRNRVGKTS